MTPNVHLWKFWIWEISLTLVLLGVAVGGLFFAPEWARVVWERPIEAAGLAVFLLLVVAVMAYRFTTGAMVGVALWLARLLGSGLAVALVILLPVLLLRSVLKPEYFGLSSPFVALFVLWCFYGFVFFVRWQTRIFYRSVDDSGQQISKSAVSGQQISGQPSAR